MNKIDGDQAIFGEECMLCKQKFKNYSDMASLARFSFRESFASSFHGKNEKSGILFEKCGHKVHPSCFLQIPKNQSLECKCPVCPAKCNTILPTRIVGNKKILRQCGNALNSLFVTKFKDINFKSLVPLLYRHLIFSLGVESLTSPELFHQKKEKKANLNTDIIILLFDSMGVQKQSFFKDL